MWKGGIRLRDQRFSYFAPVPLSSSFLKVYSDLLLGEKSNALRSNSEVVSSSLKKHVLQAAPRKTWQPRESPASFVVGPLSNPSPHGSGGKTRRAFRAFGASGEAWLLY